eukprot:scaffold3359_cov123-Cylindrotheca_fusiformis.AAC.18
MSQVGFARIRKKTTPIVSNKPKHTHTHQLSTEPLQAMRFQEETKEPEQNVYTYYGEVTVPLHVRHVRVDSSIKEIRAKTFKNCKHLVEVDLPEGLKIIGRSAFESCTSLKVMDVPSTVTEIREQAFLRCFALQFVHFSQDLQLIGDEAFALCESLKNVDIPPSTRTIGDNAFMNCQDLASADLHEGMLEVIGEDAFCGCMSLRKIRIPWTVEEILEGCFSACQSLVSVELHKKLQAIHDHAFEGCTNLRNVAIPSSVTSVGTKAFDMCTALEEEHGDDIVGALRNRFLGFPIHELCYYQSYYPTLALMDVLKQGFAMFDTTGEPFDLGSGDGSVGMTPLGILSMSVKPNFAFAKGLISVHSVSQLETLDQAGYTFYDYLCWNNSTSSLRLVKFAIQQIVLERVDALSPDQWKVDIY